MGYVTRDDLFEEPVEFPLLRAQSTATPSAYFFTPDFLAAVRTFSGLLGNPHSDTAGGALLAAAALTVIGLATVRSHHANRAVRPPAYGVTGGWPDDPPPPPGPRCAERRVRLSPPDGLEGPWFPPRNWRS